MTRQRLVLVGGGHSHALVLKHWCNHPLKNVDLTLVSNVRQTPYSGMLPGHVAGVYSVRESHINLPPLAAAAGAKFILDEAIALNPEQQVLTTRNQGKIPFDLLSLDIGSTPYCEEIQGAAHGIPAKPVPQFLHAWQQLLQQLADSPPSLFHLAIVGGGAGGVELALNIQQRLTQDCPQWDVQLHLWQRGANLLPHHSSWVQSLIKQLMRKRQIAVHCHQTVTSIVPILHSPAAAFPQYWLQTASGEQTKVNAIFLLTQASAPEWLATSGLKLDHQGFVLVSSTLQSLSHDRIFAAGDIATQLHARRPKAGVFAVRQGKPLFVNLQRAIQGRPLRPFLPQKDYLSLIGTGDGKAIALRGNWGSYGRGWWWLKTAIDRRFMAQFPQR